jgi:hypothetical protein
VGSVAVSEQGPPCDVGACGVGGTALPGHLAVHHPPFRPCCHEFCQRLHPFRRGCRNARGWQLPVERYLVHVEKAEYNSGSPNLRAPPPQALRAEVYK